MAWLNLTEDISEAFLDLTAANDDAVCAALAERLAKRDARLRERYTPRPAVTPVPGLSRFAVRGRQQRGTSLATAARVVDPVHGIVRGWCMRHGVRLGELRKPGAARAGERRMLVLALHAAGVPLRRIARLIERDPSTVRHALRGAA
jgi:hypothetical protein